MKYPVLRKLNKTMESTLSNTNNGKKEEKKINTSVKYASKPLPANLT